MTPAGRPCQDKPEGDHLARYLDAYTAGKLTRAYMAMVLGEMVVIDVCVVIEWDERVAELNRARRDRGDGEPGGAS
jgi:hypothetical protein